VLIRRAALGQRAAVDVRSANGLVSEIGPGLEAAPGETVLEAEGGALLPGLHDHHLHLMALAAAIHSVRCGPPQVGNADELSRALHAAPGHTQWIRGIGYHESVAGELERTALDRIAPARPVRIQHRSGALWILNSQALVQLRLDEGIDARGVERDEHGHATGRLYRLDAWLRERLGRQDAPSLAQVSQQLAGFGVTGLTDATPGNDDAQLTLFEAAAEAGELRQRLVVMGADRLRTAQHPRIERGARKFLLHEDELPPFDELQEELRDTHRGGRSVAIHCVTRAELVFALEALSAAGAQPGDRIEHAAIAPPELARRMAELGVCVVTQPNFVRERGDVYLREVDPSDRPWLYRCGQLIGSGVATGGGTDAPFGEPDPWLAMQAAVDRRSAEGELIGADEALTPERALALFTSAPGAPGASPRSIEVRGPADFCLLERPWSAARNSLCCDAVAATVCAGELIYRKA
jgi:predicted amidohydrolase YtcJ